MGNCVENTFSGNSRNEIRIDLKYYDLRVSYLKQSRQANALVHVFFFNFPLLSKMILILMF